ncbi:MAG: S9 family peptidase [Chloroflexi bacterium]|nr:S9 family peptidase [Chloroflexota bacterium]
MTRPYVAWPSPISVGMVVGGSRSLGGVWLDGDDLYWLEGRPEEGGRQVLMRATADGRVEDVSVAGVNVRNMVHEYGGGAFVVDDGLVVFSDLADGRLHAHRAGQAPRPVTAEGPFRYADLRIDRARGRVLCVREDHSADGEEPQNTIASVDLGSGQTTVLVSGRDFYSHPRLDPAGARLCWLTWSHPDMPWDATELWVADVSTDGSVAQARLIAGGPSESVAQPEWAPDGSLVFAYDRTGWYNLYRWREDSPGLTAAEPLAPMAAEFTAPQWVFGWSDYGIDDDGTIVAAGRSQGADRLYRIDRGGGSPIELRLPYPEIHSVRVGGGRVAFCGAGPATATSIMRLELRSGETTLVHRASELAVDPAYLSTPRAISFPTTGGLEAHALFYPPANPRVRAPSDERPPLIVISHGGPTSNATASLDLEIQFFTSRGFAVVDVDYGGSTGYGRAYRERLERSWGIVDVEDCVAAARHLADSGQVDPARLLIRGGSAGGYTTLRALTTTDVFAAGASHYGVGDLEALARDTHKFESRYLDRLVGRYPDEAATYRERSPIHATDRLSCPLIVLQGLDDRVVPPAQAEQLVAALDAKGIPHAYLAFEGEGHGFRRAENMARALEAELSFYAQLFGIEPADDLEPVLIRNAERMGIPTAAL